MTIQLRTLAGVGALVVGALVVTAVAIFDPTRPAPPVEAQTTTGSLFCASGLPCTTSSLYDAPLQDRLEVTGGSADRLVRGSAADAWTSIELQARAFVSAVHQVPNDDRLLSVGRDSTRAMMLIMLLDLVERSAAGETLTPSEQAAVDAFEDALRTKRTEAARLAVAEYDRWALSPCTYRVPAGYGFDQYGTVPCSGITTFSGPPPPPSIEQFQSYGAALANATLLGADEAAAAQRLQYALAYTTALVAGVSAGALAGVLAAAVPGLGLSLLVAIGSAGAAKIAAGTVWATFVAAGAGAGIVSGAVLLAASVVTIILIATAVTIIGAIQFAENARVRPALVEALDAAGEVDLAATAATDEGLIELVAVILDQTSPDLPAERVANAVAPTAWTPGNPEWSVLHPNGTRTRQAVLTTYTWEARAQETFISEGYFVTRSQLADGSWSPWRLSLTLEHFVRTPEGALVQRTVGISRDTLIPLDPSGGTTPPPSASFQPVGFLFNGGSVATVSIIGNLPPTLAPTLSSQPVIGTPFTFTANERDSDGDPVTVEWYIEDPTRVVAAGDVSLCGLGRIVPATLENILTPRCPWPAYAGNSVTLTYGQAGTFGALAVATDSQGVRSSQRFTFTVSPVSPTLTVDGPSVRFLTEGNAVTIAGSVVYPGPTTGWDRPTLHVDWGDGTTSRLCAPFTAAECPLELSGGPLITDPRPFSIDHVYVNDPRRPIPTNMAIRVWASVPSGAQTSVVEIPVALNNVVPSLTLNPNSCPPEVVLCLGDPRGRTTVITGRIDDVIGSAHRISVDWGDGNSDILTPGCTEAGCPGTVLPWGAFIAPSPPLIATHFQLRHDYAPSDVPYEATVTVWDGSAVIGPTVPLTISVVNRPPTVSDAIVPFRLGGAFSTPSTTGLLANANDPDGDLLTAALLAGPAQGTVTVEPNGAWRYIAGDATEDQEFTFTVSDPFDGTVTGTVQLDLVDSIPNQAPIVEEAVISVLRGNRFTADALTNFNEYATDPDGDELTFELETDPTLGVAQVAPDGSWSYTAGRSIGADTFTYRATDPNGGSTIGTVRVEVTLFGGVNSPPQLAVGPTVANVTPGTTVTRDAPGLLIGAFDLNFETLTTSLGTPPTKGTAIVLPSGAWSYTPDFDAAGTDTFGFVISDEQGLTTTGTVNITIDPPAIGPVVTPRTVTTPLGTPVLQPAPGLLGDAVDPGGLALRAALVTPPTKGTADVFPDGAWSFTPNPGASGADSFTFAVLNTGGGVTVSTMQLVIGSLDPPPTDPPPTDPPPTDPTTTAATTTTTTTTATATTMPSPSTTTGPTTTPATSPFTPVGTVPTGLPALGATPPPFTSPIIGVSSPLRQGQRVVVPLPPGTREYRVALFSTPVVLASGGAASSAEVVIPLDTAPGRHTLVMWALVGDQVQVSGLVVDVLVLGPSGRLPETGGSPWRATSVALLLLLLGMAIVVSTRRHRAAVEFPTRR